MAKVRSRGNKSTELIFAKLLRVSGLCGWRRNQKIVGNPDFVFRKYRLSIFIDGCFWHGCGKHCRMPVSNKQYWKRKINGNRKRDIRSTRILKERGWHVLRLWEHELDNPKRCIRVVAAALTAKRNRDTNKV
ncbi:MAG: very short patch repair endonuclease [Candidatus Pacebacteria bacterium]|nr:very short patch repair endonuclease [Candidatus Paceibacterota bacterium]